MKPPNPQVKEFHQAVNKGEVPTMAAKAPTQISLQACLYAAGAILVVLYTSNDVPSGKYFVMGDNLANAIDSRAFGCVPKQAIKGRVFYIIRNMVLWRA